MTVTDRFNTTSRYFLLYNTYTPITIIIMITRGVRVTYILNFLLQNTDVVRHISF